MTHWVTVGPTGAWFQATCTCGFTGTERTQARTADDDAQSHASNKGHLWAIS